MFGNQNWGRGGVIAPSPSARFWLTIKILRNHSFKCLGFVIRQDDDKYDNIAADDSAETRNNKRKLLK